MSAESHPNLNHARRFTAGEAQQTRLARCTERGCPIRWATGNNRPCADHQFDHDIRQVRETQSADDHLTCENTDSREES